MTMIDAVAGIIVLTFIMTQIIQWLEIYSDRESIKKMLKQFMMLWTVLSIYEICIFIATVGLCMMI